MLVYLGRGGRDYGNSPLKVMRRQAWEFQAVVAGRIAPVFEDGPAPLRSNRLWVFPPGHPHGWHGDPAADAEVVVFHFPSVAAAFGERVPVGGHLEVALAEEDRARLVDLAARASAELARPHRLTHLRQDHLRLELCLLAVDLAASAPVATASNRVHPAVERAIHWFEQHLSENPGLDAVGRAVGASPAHLRRLFHESLGCAPAEAFRRIRFQRAADAMAETRDTFETIAERCGFGSASAFSRAFKQRMGYPPREWRRGLSPRPVPSRR
ncbi:MAG: helix-turn-helix transcriptional regulator [Opitutales bacterium]|nr:helix-turn-helix transcriptional regulator [Opitutales bacterium]